MGQGRTQTSNASCQRPADWWNVAPLQALRAELAQKLETVRRHDVNILNSKAILAAMQRDPNESLLWGDMPCLKSSSNIA